ncbi:MAG: exosortase system-associated protein, TIGR04073 family [Candidatus Omnitrophica bacterium]|nr:exosortase system-associated protein, TIGR04073 family [Candidatus Omnitrophota bacterium]
MKRLLAIFIGMIFVLSVAISALAADMPAKAQVTPVKAMTVKATPQKMSAYPAGPIQKLERGFNNTVFGWTEIPKRIVDKTKESNPIKGVLLGVFQGSCKAFARTVSGISEVLTFPIGRYDKPRVLPDMPAAR